MNLLRITHVNTGDVGYVIKENIGTFHHSKADNCTHIMLTGGAIFPAKESLEYFFKHIEGTGEKKHGRIRTNTKPKNDKRVKD